MFLDSLPSHRLALIRLNLEFPLPVEVLKVTLDGLEVLTSVGENFDHHLRCTPNGPRDQLDLPG
jgi:hypothetical protein